MTGPWRRDGGGKKCQWHSRLNYCVEDSSKCELYFHPIFFSFTTFVCKVIKVFFTGVKVENAFTERVISRARVFFLLYFRPLK